MTSELNVKSGVKGFVALSLAHRFWSKVDKSGDCWPWLAYKSELGYGLFRYQGQMHRAHRVAYELTYGELPAELDHLCRNRACVNPAHLEPVTRSENMLRADIRKTVCIRGHVYDRVRKEGWQSCSECQRIRREKWAAKNKR